MNNAKRLTQEEIIKLYPNHTVGLNNVIEGDKGEIVSAEVVYALKGTVNPSEADNVPIVDMLLWTEPSPFGMLI